MKNKVVTTAAMAGLLGIYSAGVYHFSAPIGDQSFRVSELPAPSADEKHVERIMRAIQTQGPAPVETNLPVPGATCEITVSDFEEPYVSDLDVEYCLDTVYAGLAR